MQQSSASCELPTFSRYPWSHPKLNQFIIFISQVPPHVTRSSLLQYLSLFGPVVWMAAFRSSSNDHHHYVYFIYAEPDSLREFLKSPLHTIQSQHVGVSLWLRRDADEKTPNSPSVTKLFVKNLSSSTDEKLLHSYFSMFGAVSHVEKGKRNSGLSKRYCCITYCNPEAAHLCLAADHPKLGGFKLKCRPYFESLEAGAQEEPMKLQIDSRHQRLAGKSQEYIELIQQLKMNMNFPRSTGDRIKRMSGTSKPSTASQYQIETAASLDLELNIEASRRTNHPCPSYDSEGKLEDHPTHFCHAEEGHPQQPIPPQQLPRPLLISFFTIPGQM